MYHTSAEVRHFDNLEISTVNCHHLDRLML